MTEPSDQARLRALEERIRSAKGEAKQPSAAAGIADGHNQAQLAWRMVIELVVGIAIGFGIGFGLDRLFGTMPLFLVTFIFLGLAAGIRVMMRTAAEVQTARQVTGVTADDEGK